MEANQNKNILISWANKEDTGGYMWIRNKMNIISIWVIFSDLRSQTKPVICYIKIQKRWYVKARIAKMAFYYIKYI